MQETGTFFVIEGSDRTHNIAQLQLLKSRLEQEGHKVTMFDFPQRTQPSSFFATEYLSGKYGDPEALGPYTSSLFFALDRYQAALAITQALSEGKVVLAHRYTGSNMAYQGAKIADNPERQQFFNWLYNFELQMLRLPRPAKSFVLQNSEPDTFSPILSAFPGDFEALPLDDKTSGVIWEHVLPFLPTKPGPETAAQSVPTARVALTPVPHASGYFIVFEGISELLARKLTQNSQVLCFEQRDALNRSYIPEYLDADTKEQYRQTIDQILNLQAKIADEAALPVSVLSTAVAYGSEQALRNLVHELQSDNLPEACMVGEKLAAVAQEQGIEIPKQGSVPLSLLQKLADEHLPQLLSPESTPVQLTNVWPRNEIDLVPDILYPHSSASLEEITQEVSGWPYARKLEVFEACLNDTTPSQGLQKARYNWDIVSDYRVFRDITRQHQGSELAWQQLTPRYGYEVPQAIEDANLTDDFLTCFDLSLQLYSLLQQHGYALEAQYATLFGHKLRWNVTYNACEMLQLSTQATAPALVSTMQEAVAKLHPMLGEALLGSSTSLD